MGGSWWDNFNSAGGGSFFSGGFSPSDLEGAFHDLGGILGNIWQDVAGGGVDTSGGTSAAPGGVQPQQPGNLSDLQNLLQSLRGGAGGGGGGGVGTGPAGYTTPDGVFVKDGSVEDRYYKLVDAVWVKIFGAHPDFAQARVFHDMGIENTDQLQQVIRRMPSHIKMPDGTPINIGTYEDILATGDKLGQQYLGRPIPDSLITQWVADGVTEPAAIENWFFTHPAKDVPPDQYGQIWDSANQWIQSTWANMK